MWHCESGCVDEVVRGPAKDGKSEKPWYRKRQANPKDYPGGTTYRHHAIVCTECCVAADDWMTANASWQLLRKLGIAYNALWNSSFGKEEKRLVDMQEQMDEAAKKLTLETREFLAKRKEEITTANAGKDASMWL